MAIDCSVLGQYNIISMNGRNPTQTDLGTYVVYGELPPFCNASPGGLSTDESGIWNCSLCGNDRAYFIPWTTDERGFIHFQFQEHDSLSPDWKNPIMGEDDFFRVYVQNGCADDWIRLVPAADEFEWWAGADEAGTFNFQNIKINVAALVTAVGGINNVACCQRFKFEFLNADGVYVTYYSEAYDYHAEYCGTPVVKLEGKYDDFDCAGFYYVEPSVGVGFGVVPVYKNIVGVWGKFYQVSFEFDTTRTESNEPTANGETRNYELRGKSTPPFMAEWLARIYGSKKILVDDGAEAYFYKESAYQKQMDNSRMWKFRPQFTTKKCILFFGCPAP